MENGFKKGDSVVCVDDRLSEFLVQGKHYTVTHPEVLFDDFVQVEGFSYCHSVARFAHVDKQQVVTPKNKPYYSFHIQNTIDIVDEDIMGCVTKELPFHYYDVDSAGETQRYVVIHHTLVRKATHCDFGPKPKGCTALCKIDSVAVIFICNDFGKAVKWARNVKYGRRNMKNKQTIEVYSIDI